MHIHSGCDWAVTLDSMQEDYPVLCAFAQIARRLDCRRPRMCVRWLRKREGDGVRQNRPGSSFPTGTLIVNIAGCLLLGGVTQFGLHHLSLSPNWRIGLSVGFLGAFTTFSTFGLETVRLMEDGEWIRAVLYVSSSIIGGVLAIVGGMRIADMI